MSGIFQRQLAEYADYHRDQRNCLMHIIGNPILFMAAVLPLSLLPVTVFGVQTSAAPLLVIPALILWVAWDVGLGLAIVAAAIPLLLVAATIANHVSVAAVWIITAFLTIIGWALQIVGHQFFERRRPALLPVALATILATACTHSAAAQVNSILTYHGDAGRSGNFTVPGLTLDKARSTHLDAAFDARIAGHVYAQPLYWRDAGSDSAIIIAATENDIVQAFDATSGKELWRRSVGHPLARSLLPCGNVNPLGITGTPVIDPSTKGIYFDAGVYGTNGPRHEVFGLSLRDGTVLPGWPIDVAEALGKSGQQFDARTQNQRAALSLLDDSLYVPFGGHFGDCGDYHGWVVKLPLHDPGNVIAFKTRARGGGIWAPGGIAVVGRDIFFATGNTFGASTWSDGEAVFRVGPDLQLTGNKRDYFAPSDWKMLDANDEDLGGSNPLPLDFPTASSGRALLLALGKDGKAYLLDRNDLGGIGGQLAAEKVTRTGIITSPVAYPVGIDIFAAFQAPGAHCPGATGGLTALKISPGSPRMNIAWCADLNGRGAAIVTTTDGHSEPIVWILGAEGDNRLHAFRGDTGEPIYASEPLRGLRHFQTLIATRDRLYVAADQRIYAFAF